MAAKFKGKLNQRLEPIFFGIISEEEARQQRAPLIAERLALILEHYGIADTNHEQQMTKLAHCLLRDFVKGFQVADPYKSVGAKSVWNVVRRSFLVCEMERCIAQTTPPRTELEAARLLAQKEPWKTICAMGAHQKGGSRLDEAAETLRRRYSISKRSTPDFARRQYERQITGRRRNKFDSYDSMLLHIAKSDPRLPFI
jgi:hypothetical protein